MPWQVSIAVRIRDAVHGRGYRGQSAVYKLQPMEERDRVIEWSSGRKPLAVSRSHSLLLRSSVPLLNLNLGPGLDFNLDRFAVDSVLLH